MQTTVFQSLIHNKTSTCPFSKSISFYQSHKEDNTTLYESIKQEQLRLQTQIQQIQSQLAALPAGKLICARNEHRFKWYFSHNHQTTYLPKHKKALAEQLAIKHYLNCVLKELLQEKQAIDSYLILHSDQTPPSELLLSDESGYRQLLSPYFMPRSEELLQWQKASYTSNTKHPEQLIHKSISGNYVRSKSESMIDMCLFQHHIPFRYECELLLGEVALYPDFTIRHPKTDKIFYWEHFGLMDNEKYSKNTFLKLALYNSHGITPSMQLITTYETATNPLTFETIENLISQYFPSQW